MNPITTEINSQKKYCFNCNNSPPKLYACLSCKIAYYCNTQCQRSDWAKHKKICHNPPSDEKTASITQIAKSVSVVSQEETSSIKQLEKYLLSLKNRWDSQLSQTVQKLDWQAQAKKESQNMRIFLQLPKAARNEIVVDLGAGSGKYALHALEQGYQTIAIDSFFGFKNAMTTCKEEYGNQLELIQDDFFNYKFPKSVSYIIAMQTFQYCPPYKLVQLFKSVYESLDKSGLFYFTLWSNKNLSPNDLRYMEAVGAWSIPNFELVTKALEELGFKVKTTEQGKSSPLVMFECTKKT